MYDVVIIGGSLSGIITAIQLSKDYKVCLIDINQEIGFPTNFPGLIKNIKLLDELFEDLNQSKLYLKENQFGWGLRSEWLMKHLTNLAAKQGTEILNRTKVTNVFIDKHLSLEIIGGGPDNRTINTKIIIDESQKISPGPGKKNHKIPIKNSNIIKTEIKTKKFFVGITLSIEDYPIELSKLVIERDDGLIEVWFEEMPKIMPNNGWIEIKNLESPILDRIMLVDDYFNNSENIIQESKKYLT